MKKLFAFAAALAIAGTAYAAPNVAQNTQKGSLLIWPDIDVRGSVSTIVRLQNDNTSGTYVKCYYMDKLKNRNDFVFFITRGQPIWFDAYTGAGTLGANPFPSGFGAGMLICWAVDANENPVKWNHLSGTATVVDYDMGTAYEYSSWNFFASGTPVLSTINLSLAAGGVKNPECSADGTKCTAATGLLFNGGATGYDRCPNTLIGQFSPEGAVLGDEGGKALMEFGQTRVTLVGCYIDLRQNYYRFDTKYTFDVWNENELKLTGAHDCADGWHETNLTNVKAQGDNFSIGDLKTDAARYRVIPTKDDFICSPLKTHKVGVVGIQATEVSLDGGFAKVGTHLTAVGQYDGFVLYDAAGGVDEGAIR